MDCNHVTCSHRINIGNYTEFNVYRMNGIVRTAPNSKYGSIGFFFQ